MMAELEASEAYVPRTVQAWRTLMNWIAFLLHIFGQILRFDQVLSFVGLRHGSFLSSAPREAPQFKPLPVVEVAEEHQSAPPSAAVPVVNGGGRLIVAPPLEKLTVASSLLNTAYSISEEKFVGSSVIMAEFTISWVNCVAK
ncbi:CTD small phosphatase-like protein 2-like [Dorcoceras hygrometricum]|uniref:CTD small phosphatase-like protein 2-like n=1 Tax=Dorcoceras hygrometricum TaxID=472368 RepID=A0A2Z7BM15_9LAMI|nr:CTD small phosphatase-like protein 2-like [Dorcoceras hygrometricum]